MMLNRVRCKVLGYPCPLEQGAKEFRDRDPDILWLREQKHAAQNAVFAIQLRQEMDARHDNPFAEILRRTE